MNKYQAEVLSGYIRQYFENEPDCPVWKWAEQNITLSPLESADMPGLFSSDITPFIREPLECFRDDSVNDLTLVFGTQIVKTLMLMIGVGWWLDHNAGRVIWVLDTEANARSFSETRWQPLLESSPALSALIPSNKDKYKHLEQHLGKSLLNFVGSNSPGNLASRPAELLIMDECDKFRRTTKDEADAVELAEQRTKSRANARKVKVSSPTVPEGLIWKSYLSGTMERYMVPCPLCNKLIELRFDQLKWSQDAKHEKGWDYQAVCQSAVYVCQECGKSFDNRYKTAMLREGEWQAVNEYPIPGARSFNLSSMYSPWAKTTWGEMAVEFLKAKARWDMKGFENGWLARPTEEEADSIEPTLLSARREKYSRPVPDGVGLLTAGVDIQDDRLECEIVGWGAGLESWSVQYHVLHGDPARHYIWRDLDQLLLTGIDGYSISAAAIDTGGHYTNEAYQFCKDRYARRVFAVKGSNQAARAAVSRPSTSNKLRVRLFTLGTDTIKGTLFSLFKVAEHGPGYCHFPDNYDDEYFRQLAAEELRVKYKEGRQIHYWRQTRPRNEALDCRVYAYSALQILPPHTLARALARPRPEPADDPAPEPGRIARAAASPRRQRRPHKPWSAL